MKKPSLRVSCRSAKHRDATNKETIGSKRKFKYSGKDEPSKGTVSNVVGSNRFDWIVHEGIFQGIDWDKPWDVPWGVSSFALGSVLWIVAYISSAVLAPAFVSLGKGHGLVTEDVLGLSILVAQVGQALGTVAALSLATGGELFQVMNYAPWKIEDGWWRTSLSGVPLALAAVAVTSIAASAFGLDHISGGGSTEVVAQTLSTTPATSTALLLTCAVFAPWTEEIFFRGFLLTTLTKWIPVPWAIVSSAAIFSAAHLSPRDAPQLFALGVVLGVAYTKNRNLAAPMAIHGLWNGSVFTALQILLASGVDINAFLAGDVALDCVKPF